MLRSNSCKTFTIKILLHDTEVKVKSYAKKLRTIKNRESTSPIILHIYLIDVKSLNITK